MLLPDELRAFQKQITIHMAEFDVSKRKQQWKQKQSRSLVWLQGIAKQKAIWEALNGYYKKDMH